MSIGAKFFYKQKSARNVSVSVARAHYQTGMSMRKINEKSEIYFGFSEKIPYFQKKISENKENMRIYLRFSWKMRKLNWKNLCWIKVIRSNLDYMNLIWTSCVRELEIIFENLGERCISERCLSYKMFQCFVCSEQFISIYRYAYYE